MTAPPDVKAIKYDLFKTTYREALDDLLSIDKGVAQELQQLEANLELLRGKHDDNKMFVDRLHEMSEKVDDLRQQNANGEISDRRFLSALDLDTYLVGELVDQASPEPEPVKQSRVRIMITHNGKTQNANAWAVEMGIPYHRITTGTRKGKSLAEIRKEWDGVDI